METAFNTCSATQDVPGIGDACRTADGYFRVETEQGHTMTTHGADAPSVAIAAASYHPLSQAAIDGADASSIECVTSETDKRLHIVYARPSNVASRIDSVREPLREAIYKASAFIDSESRLLAPAAGRKLPVWCSGGVPVIEEVTVSPTAGAGQSFSGLVSDLVAAGYPASTWRSASPRRTVVFYDGPHETGAAGVGGMWLDDSASPTNSNNFGGSYATEFNNIGPSGMPTWETLLHEIGHNMGAVSDNAPDSSQAGHCNDGLDIMCYNDGGPAASYNDAVCAQTRLDCGHDTYFNPAPAGGSWLATHWNVAHVDNAWLVDYDASWDDGGVPDLDAPTAPSNVTASAVTHAAFDVAWSASTDARSSVTYNLLVERSDGAGGWISYATVSSLPATEHRVTGLEGDTTYRVTVTARDQAGNASAGASVEQTTASGAPSAPSSVTLEQFSATEAWAWWPDGTAPGTVTGYDVELRTG
jgi:chitodextrinase